MIRLGPRRWTKRPFFRSGRWVMPFILSAAVAACSPPLGIPHEEWARMTPGQRALAHAKAREIEAALATERARPVVAPIRASSVAPDLPSLEEVIRTRYRSGRLGDVVQCVMEPGTARFASGWTYSLPVSFVVARGEERAVPVRSRFDGETAEVWVEYADTGANLSLCSRMPKIAGPYDCALVAGSPQDLSVGTAKTITILDTLVAPVRCAFPAGSLLPAAISFEDETQLPGSEP